MAHDWICRGCGYELRGLTIDGDCPECGTLVADSVRGTGLASEDPAWLARLAGGIRIVVWGCILLLATFVVARIVDTWFDSFLDQEPVIRGLINSGPSFLTTLVILAGALSVTAQGPRVRETETSFSPRRLARACAIAAIPLVALRMVYIAAGGSPFFLRWCAGVAFFGTISLLSLYIASLARRIPDATLDRRCRDAGMWFGGSAVLHLASQAIGAFAGASAVVEFIGTLGSLGVLAFSVQCFFVWHRFRRALVHALSSP